jgi:hypothetical protein
MNKTENNIKEQIAKIKTTNQNSKSVKKSKKNTDLDRLGPGKSDDMRQKEILRQGQPREDEVGDED